MPFTRRRLFAATGATLLISLVTWWSLSKTPQSATLAAQATLRAWIDALLPAEADFPGGVALGVAEKIAVAIQKKPAYARLTREALTWLNDRARAKAGVAFAELPEPLRDEIVAAAAASAPGSTPRTFFQATWDDALFHAYADPRAWPGLGYAGPPQPIGFADHATPPKSV